MNIDTVNENSLSPESIEALYEVAYRLYEGGKFEDAEHAFRFLTTIDPLVKKNWMGLGASLQMRKKTAKALEAYSVAAVIDESDPYVSLHAADCFFALDSKEGAFAALEAAEAIAKENNKHHQLLEKIMIMRQRWSQQ